MPFFRVSHKLLHPGKRKLHSSSSVQLAEIATTGITHYARVWLFYFVPATMFVITAIYYRFVNLEKFILFCVINT